MNTHRLSLPPAAFTRLELMVVLAILGLLAAVSVPALAGSASRSARVACLNNLRLIGRAFQMWAGDHDGENPWRVPGGDGGTSYHPLADNAWFQFSCISNQLVTPKLLVCPGDEEKAEKMAANWGLGPGGLLNSTNRDRSVSYVLGIHTSANVPQSWLSGDRNVRFSTKGACSLVGTAWGLDRGSLYVGWTNSIHGLTGNLLLNDGRVLQSSSDDVRAELDVPNLYPGSGLFHFLAP
jgi:prepilin-type N-terminal cleavage/methylation domain-containing protein